MATDSRLTGRDGEVWHRYAVLSQTQEKIASELGISQSQVSNIIKKVREKLPQQTREEIAAERAEQLRAVAEAFLPKALAGSKDAAQTLIKLQEREAKLLGLDSAVKQEITADIKYEVVGIDPEDV